MKIGFIDYYLDEWHANNYPKFLADASNGEITIGSAYGEIASPITGMTSEQWCEKYGIRHAASIEQVIEENDCLVVLSPDTPEQHPHLCQLPLSSGKRTGPIVSALEPVIVLAILVVCTAYLVDGSFNPFLYFRF